MFLGKGKGKRYSYNYYRISGNKSSDMYQKVLKIYRPFHPAVSLIGIDPKKIIEHVHCKIVENSKKLETTSIADLSNKI